LCNLTNKSIKGKIVIKYPKCSSKNLAHTYTAFWATVDQVGGDAATNFSDHQSDNELTEETMCDNSA